MIRINSIVGGPFRLLQTRLASQLSIQDSNLDPNKHITMGKYVHINYRDSYDLGEYPQVIKTGSIAPKTYQPQVEEAIIQLIKNRYNVTLNLQDIINKKISRVFQKDIKTQETFNDFLPILNANLSAKIFVRESGWTWLKEQQIRLATSQSELTRENHETLADFLTEYNEFIQRLVCISRFGTCPKISQGLTAQQKMVREESEDIKTGIEALSEDRPQNSKWINKFMRMIH